MALHHRRERKTGAALGRTDDRRSAATGLSLRGAAATYENGTVGLHPTDLDFQDGELTVLLGPSGAGKSTLLRLLNFLVRPTQGTVQTPHLGVLDTPAVIRAHRRATAMIFQQHHLIGRMTALQNVLNSRLGHHPFWRTAIGFPEADRRLALSCLARVGLEDRALTRCDALSGGQQQRVGIARALAQQPAAILADEPIASLDPTSATRILNLLRAICHEDGVPLIVSLHQLEHARAIADRIIGLDGGRVVFDGPPTELSLEMVARIYGTSDRLSP